MYIRCIACMRSDLHMVVHLQDIRFSHEIRCGVTGEHTPRSTSPHVRISSKLKLLWQPWMSFFLVSTHKYKSGVSLNNSIETTIKVYWRTNLPNNRSAPGNKSRMRTEACCGGLANVSITPLCRTMKTFFLFFLFSSAKAHQHIPHSNSPRGASPQRSRFDCSAWNLVPVCTMCKLQQRTMLCVC